MKGFLFIEPDGYDTDEDLEFWIGKCLEFKPRAKSSKKKYVFKGLSSADSFLFN